MSAPLLEARDVRVELGGTEIVHAADLELQPGRLVAMLGPNGAGKTTFARAVAGLAPHAAGSVRWGDEDVGRLRGRRLAQRRAFVPQRPRVPDGVTVHEAVLLGRTPHVARFRRLTAADHDVVDTAIDRVGVTALRDRKLATLSGGEAQRVHFAVAVAQAAPCLIADEPTSSLDLGATADIARLVRALADDGLAVLLVLHDLALAAALADEVVVMDGGRTVVSGPPREVLDSALLADVWKVEAEVEWRSQGRTGLHVDWLDGPGTFSDGCR